MSENSPVYEALEQAFSNNKKAAIATVIRVLGSSYRKEGAKMYVDESGHHVGLISGGCLESDVAEIAKEVIATGKAQLKYYDMREDEVWGLGLGCPGKVQVYIEPVN